MSTPEEGFVAVGTPIDLENCAREPIHIPGSIQPRGVLVVVHEPDFSITQVSANVDDLLAVSVQDVLGAELHQAIGDGPAAEIQRASASFTNLHDRNPIELTIAVRGVPTIFDAILHRQDTVLLVELEPAEGPRPFSFPNTYRAVRSAVEELNRATTLDELYSATARSVRSLTGFDRVMVYRYDHEYNGEVVAEHCLEGLNSFLGLHYPASDIPVQARALYEKNWIRLISDIGYTPSPLVPAVNPKLSGPLDLTQASLRSVSPIHVEYLQNMGVRASMSISLLRDGKLWGLIACHHYSGPHLPPFGTRAAAEFLGSTLSLRLVDQFDEDAIRHRLASQAVLAKITAATFDESEPINQALLGAPDLLDLVAADGVALYLGGRYETRGEAQEQNVSRAVAAWGQSTGEEIVATDFLARTLPGLDVDPSRLSGVLVMTLPEGQFAVWSRAEALRSVDWGGDPRNKAIAVEADDGIRVSPRQSFERWREVVRGRSTPWESDDLEVVAQLRRHVIEAMYQRSRRDARLAETLQRSLLPDLPGNLTGWEVSAHYEPAAAGRIGGDWYDSFRLGDGRLAVVLGDVAGHGIGAAGTMIQLRNVLRAYLFSLTNPVHAVQRLNEFCTTLLGGVFATVIVGCVDLESGEVEVICAGHPRPFVVDDTRAVARMKAVISPPIGVRGANYRCSSFTIEPGSALLMFSDGLVERRDEDIDIGLERLASALRALPDAGARAVWQEIGATDIDDDATVISLHRSTRPPAVPTRPSS